MLYLRQFGGAHEGIGALEVAMCAGLVIIGAAVDFGIAVRGAELGTASAFMNSSDTQPLPAELAARLRLFHLLLLGFLLNFALDVLEGVAEAEDPRVLQFGDFLDASLATLAARLEGLSVRHVQTFIAQMQVLAVSATNIK